MSRYVPVIIGVLLIVGLTIPEIQITDRFQSSNIKAEQFAEVLSLVPKTIGPWEGTDLPVEEQVRKTAGAVGYVSRAYQNTKTGEQVTLWLIVGHSRDITGHTPDVCYPSSGFKKRAENNSLHTFAFDEQPPAKFWTNTFLKEDFSGSQMVRVFWSWYKPNETGEVEWKAPDHALMTFGNARSLYKMYFSSPMREQSETADRSPCLKFAEIFMPILEEALASVQAETAPNGTTASL